MKDLGLERPPANDVAFPQQLIDFHCVRRFPAEPQGLLTQYLVQPEIVGMHVDGSVSRVVHAAQSDDVIDVRMREDDGRDLQMVPLDYVQNFAGIVSGIDHDGFAGLRIADNVAVALQHADRKNFVDEFFGVPHTPQYNI